MSALLWLLDLSDTLYVYHDWDTSTIWSCLPVADWAMCIPEGRAV